MPTAISFDPQSQPVPLSRPALPTMVCRVDDAGGLALVPNVRFEGGRLDEGPATGQGTFHYVFDTGGAVDVNREWPTSPEQVFGADAPPGPFVVRPDDRLAAYALTYEGDLQILFDGFASIPASTISARRTALEATFVAQGTPIRLFDAPIFDRLERDCDKYNHPGDAVEKFIDLPTRFNPKGKANATQQGQDSTRGSLSFPCFLDDRFIEDAPKPADGVLPTGRLWTVAMAVKYLLALYNSEQKYVLNPDFATLDDLLNAREPKDKQYYNSSEESSYDARPIILKETDVTGLSLPDALNAVLYPYGFRMRFQLGQDQDDAPTWTLVIIRLDDLSPSILKKVFIQDGGDLDPLRSNVGELHLVQDQVDVANAYVVETDFKALEGSFVLAPLFKILPGDEADATLKKFNTDDVDFGAGENENKYRLYGLDECGEGHTDVRTGTWSTDATSLAGAIGGPDQDEKLYARRRRPGSDALFTKTATGEPERALLLISWDYAGKAPAVWDGSGTWYPVSKTWRLMKDRLGVYITAKNPNAWSVSNTKVNFGVNRRSSGGIVKGVSAQCVAGETRFFLMLTTVIECDQVGGAKASKRAASPGKFTITRVIDARERYKVQGILGNSWFNKTAKGIITRDDRDKAVDDASSRRTANEMPRIAGPIMIPRLTTGYSLGDRLTDVVGRTLNLRTNAGDSGGEGPLYPRVTSIEFSCNPEQSVTLHASDDRGWKRVKHGA